MQAMTPMLAVGKTMLPHDPEKPHSTMEPCRSARLAAKAANPHTKPDAGPLLLDPSDLSDLTDLSDNEERDMPGALAMTVQSTDEETWIP